MLDQSKVIIPHHHGPECGTGVRSCSYKEDTANLGHLPTLYPERERLSGGAARFQGELKQEDHEFKASPSYIKSKSQLSLGTAS